MENMTPEAAKKKAFTDAALQIGEAIAGGLVSGAVSSSAFTGVQSLVDQASYAKTGAGIMDTDGGVETLISVANEAAGVSSTEMQSMLTSQIDKVNQNPTARNVGKLYTTVQAANNQTKASVGQSNATTQMANDQVNTSINQADVAESLKGTGIPAHKIDTLSQAIVARVNGQELTQTQREVLRSELSRSSVQNIISDLMEKKTNGVDSVQNDVYDDSNLRDGMPYEENTALQNLSDQGVDAFSDHENGTVIDGAALQQFQNASSEEIYKGGASVPRPTWRQSELDAVADFPEYKAQKSFLNGKEVPYGTKGSVRPDYYKSGFSVDIKNYNVESTNSRSNLARNIETQYSQRIENLPDGTKQAVLIDVRGQNVSISALLVLYNDIIQRTNNGVEVLFKIN